MTRSPWLTGLALGIVIGAIAAGFAVFAALDHNPQGEFQRGGSVQVGPLLLIGGSWFGLVGAVVWLVLGSALAILRRRREHHAA